ncbi:hypothetical protein BS50DRAFT_148069 [Corynespora cassiicola Philippines]|uniref:Uncharacterized protein n=1 Tax=Corynespora cassiicola Philippines TaxID=1448308 RepID=A0A2T2N909_CORCC|nr:hypothetical protein BS50DRAFT_148069 [Corynespora cassiicola Philippines]
MPLYTVLTGRPVSPQMSRLKIGTAQNHDIRAVGPDAPSDIRRDRPGRMRFGAACGRAVVEVLGTTRNGVRVESHLAGSTQRLELPVHLEEEEEEEGGGGVKAKKQDSPSRRPAARRIVSVLRRRLCRWCRMGQVTWRRPRLWCLIDKAPPAAALRLRGLVSISHDR